MKFQINDHVRKIPRPNAGEWQGRVVGTYSTSRTPEGYAVESEREPGSVQIYPANALELVPVATQPVNQMLLEALRATHLELHYCSQQLCASGWTEGSTVRGALDHARAAIAAAEGEV